MPKGFNVTMTQRWSGRPWRAVLRRCHQAHHVCKGGMGKVFTVQLYIYLWNTQLNHCYVIIFHWSFKNWLIHFCLGLCLNCEILELNEEWGENDINNNNEDKCAVAGFFVKSVSVMETDLLRSQTAGDNLRQAGAHCSPPPDSRIT